MPGGITLPGVRQSEFEAMLALDERHWWYRGRRRVLDAVLHGIPLPPPGQTRILDAGCGSGRTLDDLARHGEAHGIELNPLGIEAARRRGHEVREAPVEAIPHPDASFDLVTCLDVIEHTDDDVRSLTELRRVTRPGGAAPLTGPAAPRRASRRGRAPHGAGVSAAVVAPRRGERASAALHAPDAARGGGAGRMASG